MAEVLVASMPFGVDDMTKEVMVAEIACKVKAKDYENMQLIFLFGYLTKIRYTFIT